ncbi:MAG: hypothetical protein QHH18_07845 [Candidatus Bathyarchaeota archaeon]|jgi:hypothetical protein|nr:hypothetical protein [Candidatus Bathyarchaeota archaeon A05DMB-5]MDH7558492.1 hypothetical protein [Candidatus Bathyarchaeota archaeon]
MQSKPRKIGFAKLEGARKKRFLKIVIFLLLLAVGLLGFWFTLKFALNTEQPLLIVSSGDMCTVQVSCDGFTHPFEHTLHRGDVIVVQGVDAENVNSEYPNSDIVVFRVPQAGPSPESGLVITRVVAKTEVNGTVYFQTKSDGKGIHKWPEQLSEREYDIWSDYSGNYTWNGMISEKLLIGKVIFRVPWIGHLVFFVSSYFGMLVVMILIFAIIIVKLLIPKLRKNRNGRT